MQRVSRMKRELSMLETEPPPGVSCWGTGDHVTHLEAQIVGGENTPYAGGVFKLEIHIPDRYPFEPPKVQYRTPIYHPNIDTSGRICLDLLKMPPAGNWKPSLNISTVLTSLQLLMADPNPDDPLMADISTEFKHDRALFMQKAKEWTARHATSSNIAAVSTTQETSSDESSDSEADSDSDDSQEENKPQTHLSDGISKSANQIGPSSKSTNQNACYKGDSAGGSELTNERRGEKRCLQEVNGDSFVAKKSHVTIKL